MRSIRYKADATTNIESSPGIYLPTKVEALLKKV